jgi:phosphoglycerate dehydrogenase-like enzyme
MLELAILDDYQRCALDVADWSAVKALANITVFDRPFESLEAAKAALKPFDVICLMRERTAVPRALIEALPKLKFIALTGGNIPNLDFAAATEHGIVVSNTVRTVSESTAELAWMLVMATARQLTFEDSQMRHGAWQTTLGFTLKGKTLGLLGLGRLGTYMAGYGKAFGMDVVAWSQNLTAEKAEAAGARLVAKDELFRIADVVSIHLVLSDRSRGLVGAAEFGLMKPTAILVNTSRGPIIDEAAMMAALESKRIAGVGLDVYDREPLPADHPLRRLRNATLSPHVGFVTRENYRVWYEDIVEDVLAWNAGKPINLRNPEVIGKERR